jgi:tetratricopeptide (TPR) repeat protein
MLRIQGNYTEAEALQRQTLQVQRRVLGPEHPDTLNSMSRLTIDLNQQSRYAEAEQLDREALEIQRRILGPEHSDTLDSMVGLANTLMSMREYAEAEKMLKQVLDIQRRIIGPESREITMSTYDLACVEARWGKRDKALSLLREVVDHGQSAVIDSAMAKDPDLISLHGDPRFATLVAHAKERAAAIQKPRWVLVSALRKFCS